MVQIATVKMLDRLVLAELCYRNNVQGKSNRSRPHCRGLSREVPAGWGAWSTVGRSCDLAKVVAALTVGDATVRVVRVIWLTAESRVAILRDGR
jgi:hypothetical protein